MHLKMRNNFSKETERAAALDHYRRSQLKINYRTEEALLEINNALNLNPKFAEAYTLISGLNEEMKLYDKALEDVNYSISINNNNAESYYQRDLALSDCMKCVEINKDFSMGYCRMGTIMSELKQQDNELEYFNQAIEKDGNYYYSFICKGMYYQDQRLCTQRFQQAIEINSKYSLAYYNRGD